MMLLLRASIISSMIGALCFLPAQTVNLDLGQTVDANCTGGNAYTIPPPAPLVTDFTLRFGSFTCKVPSNPLPYVVTFRFVEPSVQTVGGRIFSVYINRQPVIARLDLVADAGYLKPHAISVIIMGSDALTIVFETQVRSAVISSIEFTPLFTLFGNLFDHSSGLKRIDVGSLSIIGVDATPEMKTAGWVAR